MKWNILSNVLQSINSVWTGHQKHNSAVLILKIRHLCLNAQELHKWIQHLLLLTVERWKVNCHQENKVQTVKGNKAIGQDVLCILYVILNWVFKNSSKHLSGLCNCCSEGWTLGRFCRAVKVEKTATIQTKICFKVS